MQHSIGQQISKSQQWSQDWKRSVFTLISKKGNAKECSNYCTIAFIWQVSKLMLKILQARLQQYVNCELQDVWAGFRKGRGIRDQIANFRWIIKKARQYQKNIYSVSLTTPKPLTMWITINCGKFFKRREYQTTWPASWEICMLVQATVRTRQETTDWFQLGKGVLQRCILSSCLFSLYAEYIMWNSGLDKAQAGIKIAGRNINNLRYADDTTLMAESEKN